MTEGLMPPEVLALLTPEAVSPAVVFLCGDEAPTRAIVNAGAGTFAATHVAMTQGVHLGVGGDVADALQAAWPQVSDRAGDSVPPQGAAQTQQEVGLALQARSGG
jgi:hypothetical protein